MGCEESKKSGEIFCEMHQYFEEIYTPRVKRTKSCKCLFFKGYVSAGAGRGQDSEKHYMKNADENEGWD